MLVRRAEKHDLKKLLLLYRHLHADDVIAAEEDYQRSWEEIFDNPAFNYFVIEADNQLISSCNLTVIPNLTRGSRPIGLIENVVTHADYRKQGLGRKVIQAAIDYAQEMSCYKVMLLTSSERKQAHQFYESLGFSSSDKVGFVMKLSTRKAT